MRTPGHDFELATGFLYAEGVLAPAEDLRTVAYCTDEHARPEQEFNVVTVELGRPPRRAPAERYAGLSAASSACGVCGTESIDDVLALCDVAASARWAGLRVPPEVLLALPDRLRDAQRVFDSHRGAARRRPVRRRRAPRSSYARTSAGTTRSTRSSAHACWPAARPPSRCSASAAGSASRSCRRPSPADIGVLAAVGAPSSLAVDLARPGRPVHRRVRARTALRRVLGPGRARDGV